MLVTAVLMTAIVPTLIAQRWFDPVRREPAILNGAAGTGTGGDLP